MQWKYIWREYKDSKGNKGTELAKIHAFHRVEDEIIDKNADKTQNAP